MTFIKDKESDDIYHQDTKTKYFRSGLHYGESINYSCFEITDIKLFTESDKLLIKRGFEFITKIKKVDQYFNSDLKSNKSKIHEFLWCVDYDNIIRENNFTKNQEVENLC